MRSLACSKAASLVVAVLLDGCGAAATAESDDSAFSVMDPARGASILPEIESTRGSPSVCVGLLGFEASDRAMAAEKIQTLVRDTATKWNALLEGNPEWSLPQGPIEPVFHVQDTECPRTGPGLNVNVWATEARFKDDYCSRPNYKCSSGAIPQYRTLYLGPWSHTKPADVFDAYRLLHEYGHLLGLGDTYRRPGVTNWVGEQPPSVMSGGSQVLTDDDKLGLWVALRTLRTGRRSCEGFGVDVAMTENTKNLLVCDPSAVPENTHGTPSPTSRP